MADLGTLDAWRRGCGSAGGSLTHSSAGGGVARLGALLDVPHMLLLSSCALLAACILSLANRVVTVPKRVVAGLRGGGCCVSKSGGPQGTQGMPPKAQAQAPTAAELVEAAMAAHADDPEEAARVKQTMMATEAEVRAMMEQSEAEAVEKRGEDKEWEPDEEWEETEDDRPWKENGGEELETLLKQDPALGGAPVGFLDARFIISLAKKEGGRLLRRQLIPQGAFLSLEELRSMPMGYASSLRVVCLSYPWFSPGCAASPAPSPPRPHGSADSRRSVLSTKIGTRTLTARRSGCSRASSRCSSRPREAPTACSSTTAPCSRCLGTTSRSSSSAWPSRA